MISIGVACNRCLVATGGRAVTVKPPLMLMAIMDAFAVSPKLQSDFTRAIEDSKWAHLFDETSINRKRRRHVPKPTNPTVA